MKFHVRLRTISHLIPTHITHVYVQWMSYSFVWLYLFCTYSSICWSNTKIFLSILIVFGKRFCFEKFQKIQKIFNSTFWRLTHKSWVSRPQSRGYTEVFVTLWRARLPVAKKHLENFSKILGFWLFGDSFTSGSSSREVTQRRSRLTN